MPMIVAWSRTAIYSVLNFEIKSIDNIKLFNRLTASIVIKQIFEFSLTVSVVDTAAYIIFAPHMIGVL